eukprot:5612119-Amphidinium_carterae.1
MEPVTSYLVWLCAGHCAGPLSRVALLRRSWRRMLHSRKLAWSKLRSPLLRRPWESGRCAMVEATVAEGRPVLPGHGGGLGYTAL